MLGRRGNERKAQVFRAKRGEWHGKGRESCGEIRRMT